MLLLSGTLLNLEKKVHSKKKRKKKGRPTKSGPRLAPSRRKRLLPSNAQSHSLRRHVAALPTQATCLSGLKVLGKLQTIFQPLCLLDIGRNVSKKLKSRLCADLSVVQVAASDRLEGLKVHPGVCQAWHMVTCNHHWCYLIAPYWWVTV